MDRGALHGRAGKCLPASERVCALELVGELLEQITGAGGFRGRRRRGCRRCGDRRRSPRPCRGIVVSHRRVWLALFSKTSRTRLMHHPPRPSGAAASSRAMLPSRKGATRSRHASYASDARLFSAPARRCCIARSFMATSAAGVATRAVARVTRSSVVPCASIVSQVADARPYAWVITNIASSTSSGSWLAS